MKINWRVTQKNNEEKSKPAEKIGDINNDAEIMALLESGVARLHKIPNTVGGQNEQSSTSATENIPKTDNMETVHPALEAKQTSVETHTTAAFEATIESTSTTPSTSPRSANLPSQNATWKNSNVKTINPIATAKAKGPGRPRGRNYR